MVWRPLHRVAIFDFSVDCSRPVRSVDCALCYQTSFVADCILSKGACSVACRHGRLRQKPAMSLKSSLAWIEDASQASKMAESEEEYSSSEISGSDLLE